MLMPIAFPSFPINDVFFIAEVYSGDCRNTYLACLCVLARAVSPYEYRRTVFPFLKCLSRKLSIHYFAEKILRFSCHFPTKRVYLLHIRKGTAILIMGQSCTSPRQCEPLHIFEDTMTICVFC